jgi:hypothetical protein
MLDDEKKRVSRDQLDTEKARESISLAEGDVRQMQEQVSFSFQLLSLLW